MLTTISAMEEHGRGFPDTSALRESFGSDALAALPPSLLDEMPLETSDNHEEDVFADVQAALELGGHDQSLFPMLSDTSLDCIDVDAPHQLLNAGATTVEADPFETHDLSPIMAPIVMSVELDAAGFDSDLDLPEPGTPLVLSSTPGPISMTPRLRSAPAARQVLKQLDDGVKERKAGKKTRRSPRTPAAAALAPIRRRSRDASPAAKWDEHEQNIFFSMFKIKWPPGFDEQPQKTFGTMLLQRFDQISNKIKSKSVIEVRQFYNSVMKNVAELLRHVKHDIDLANPDEVRICVWCWSKLLTAESEALDQFKGVSVMDEPAKTRVSDLLHQLIVRSRRQMLKAKTSENAHSSTHRAALTSISTWMNRSSANVFSAGDSARQQPSRKQENNTVVHHPIVRKKHQPASTASTPAKAASTISSLPQTNHIVTPNQVLTKRRRGDATAEDPVASTPLDKKRRVADPDFMSPPQTALFGRSASAPFQTPQELGRKKIYIKMRMVPKDSQTKTLVTACGARHKVELKLSSSKKMSEVVKHMKSKWSKVRGAVESTASLHFFQKGHDFATKQYGGWSELDSDVTCLDVWRECGRQVNGENVVEVSYGWVSSAPRTGSKMTSKRATGGLFGAEQREPERDVTAAGSSVSGVQDDGHPISQEVSPGRGLQAFGETVAFEREMSDHEAVELVSLGGGDLSDPGSDLSSPQSRLRRRIIPTLVSTEEFNI